MSDYWKKVANYDVDPLFLMMESAHKESHRDGYGEFD
jgi:hypothetical protein